ncbi:glycine zipper 2TM domain-containing protein [Novosphingobium sp. FKTRR1]|uniref:glycine zipper 2TM domain-containing protein n=1 Tax=unclassified Novosphingobium TaxID=2644732 RepID=UPI001CF0A2CE|nr:glycine zipper 2TM domain-containing protein [Novosphingobium sp. FKTRR1]
MKFPRNIMLSLAVLGVVAGAIPAQAAVGTATAPTALAAAYGDDWQHGREPSWNDRNYNRDGWGRGYERTDWRDNQRREDWRDDRRRDDGYQASSWRGRDGRTYCRKPDGTTGLLVGGAAGALIGRGVAGSGDRTLGAILGAAGGALLGRAIDRDSGRCR